MKIKIRKVGLILIGLLGIGLISACKKTETKKENSNPNAGTWFGQDSQGEVILLIDGNNVIYTGSGNKSAGTVNKNNEITLHDSSIDSLSYKKVGDKLSLNFGYNTTTILKKQEKPDWNPSQKVSPYGNWTGYASQTKYEVTLDKKNVLFKANDNQQTGKVDLKNQKFVFYSPEFDYAYKVIGNKLALHAYLPGSSEYDQIFLDQDKKNSKSKDSYIKKIGLGDFEVGKDIKVGVYRVDFSFENISGDSGKGTGKILVVSESNNFKDYNFTTDEDGTTQSQRIILKDGDIITTSAENGDNSEFTFILQKK